MTFRNEVGLIPGYRPGLAVPNGGIFWVHHYRHRLSHAVAVPPGLSFPSCAHCGDEVRFEPVGDVLPFAKPRSAYFDQDFRPPNRGCQDAATPLLLRCHKARGDSARLLEHSHDLRARSDDRVVIVLPTLYRLKKSLNVANLDHPQELRDAERDGVDDLLSNRAA